jgi:hypothetical protein
LEGTVPDDFFPSSSLVVTGLESAAIVAVYSTFQPQNTRDRYSTLIENFGQKKKSLEGWPQTRVKINQQSAISKQFLTSSFPPRERDNA